MLPGFFFCRICGKLSAIFFWKGRKETMNQHDLSEIRRRLNPDKRNPSVICGCYVDHIGNPITSFSVPVASLYEQENVAYMSIFKKVLSGQVCRRDGSSGLCSC